MSGSQVKAVRERLGLNQQEAARKWGMSQAYVSLVEHGKRPVPARLTRTLVKLEPSLASALPLEGGVDASSDLPERLGALGYPGFAYLANPKRVANPAAVVLAALSGRDVPARVTAALPWVFVNFPDLDWRWLVEEAKSLNLQNRLGYLLTLAGQLAAQQGNSDATNTLTHVLDELEEARLVKEDSLGRKLTETERHFLREHRPASAAHWNLLTRLKVEDLRYAD